MKTNNETNTVTNEKKKFQTFVLKYPNQSVRQKTNQNTKQMTTN